MMYSNSRRISLPLFSPSLPAATNCAKLSGSIPILLKLLQREEMSPFSMLNIALCLGNLTEENSKSKKKKLNNNYDYYNYPHAVIY